jgi:hypothetical protein
LPPKGAKGAKQKRVKPQQMHFKTMKRLRFYAPFVRFCGQLVHCGLQVECSFVVGVAFASFVYSAVDMNSCPFAL